jgi:leader peptidase (prepilin peptidase)/N-methyltransferase
MTALELPLWFVLSFAFAFSSAWGSFANVVVHRWPLGLSVVSPPSRCPRCEQPIRALDNVPVFAWLWLRGRCRDCKAPISARYPLVELAFGLVGMAIAYRVFRGEGAALDVGAALLHTLVRFSVTFALFVVALIDLDRTEVPNFVLLFAIAPTILGFATAPLAPTVDGLAALAGAGLGYFGLRLLFIDGLKLLIGRAGMLVVVGALLGPAGVLFSLGAGAVQGVIAAAVAAALGRRIGAEDVDDVEDEDDEDEDEPSAAPPHGAHEHHEGSTTPDASEEPTDLSKQALARRAPMKLPFAPFLSLAAVEYLLGFDRLLAQWLSV